ncbi:MAG TPA: thioredoxin fold domain-containing protein [Dongiaceae bacterium]|nr:thioredoxin fold domain-containing protein [Dongiaceae bacterium]
MRWITIVALAASIAVAASRPVALSAGSSAAGPAWRTWDDGLAEAKSTGHPVLVDVYTDWCGWCKRMDRDVYSRPEVRDYLGRNWVAVRINAEANTPAHYLGHETTEAEIADRFGVRSYPTTVMLKPTGERMVNVPGYFAAPDFITVLRFVGEGHMERGERFEDFQKTVAH